MQIIRAHLLRNATPNGKYTNRYRKQEYLEIPFPVFSVKAAFLCVFTTFIALFLHGLYRSAYYRQSHHTLFCGVRFKHLLNHLMHKFLDHILWEWWFTVTNKSRNVCNDMAIISFGKHTRSPYRISARRFKLRSKWPIFTKLGTNGLPLAVDPIPHTLISRTD
jgi:hypothetical protein